MIDLPKRTCGKAAAAATFVMKNFPSRSSSLSANKFFMNKEVGRRRRNTKKRGKKTAVVLFFVVLFLSPLPSLRMFHDSENLWKLDELILIFLLYFF